MAQLIIRTGVNSMYFINNGVMFDINPTGKHQIDAQEIAQYIGILPSFFRSDSEAGKQQTTQDIIDHASGCYGFPFSDMTPKSSVSSSGVYSYPEDGDLYPLVAACIGETMIYIYEYAITAFVNRDGLQYVTRID